MKTRAVKIAVLVFAAGIILILSYLPYYARNHFLKNGKEWLGRDVSLQRVHINYFTSTIRLIDFKMYEQADSSVFVSFDTLLVNLEPIKLFRNKVVIEELYLKGLMVSVIQLDSGFNFDDLLEYHAQDNDSISSGPDKAYEFEISNIELSNGNAMLSEASTGKTLRTNSIDLVIPYIAFNEHEMSEGGLKFAFQEDGYFEAKFNVQPVTGDYSASISINKLYLDPFYEFMTRYLKIGSIDGHLNGILRVSGNMNEAEKSLASGSVSLVDFEVTNDQKRKITGFKELNVVMDEADFYNQQYAFDSVIIDSPYLLLELKDSVFNLSNLAVTTTKEENEQVAKDTSTIEKDSPLSYSLNSFVVKEGIIDFIDHRSEEPFTYHLSKVEMKVDSLSSEAEFLQFYSTMLLNERGTLTAELGVNPKQPLDLTLQYVIEDFQLSDLNIYSRYYMGFPIFYGDMYYKASTTIDNGQLTSENNLIIQNVELGNKRGGLYDLPVKFALFLLKDKDGIIRLDVPVRGDLKDPKIKVGKIIWNTFKNLIVKTVAAPGKMLANLLHVDPKDIETIAFNYGDPLVTDDHRHQLDLLLELEQRKAGLEIEMIYFNDRQLEKEAIAVDILKSDFRNSGGNSNSESAFEEFVRKQYPVDSISISKSCYAIADHGKIDALAQTMEEARIQSLKEILKSKNDSTQIVVSVGPLRSPKQVGTIPIFEMKFSLNDSTVYKPEDKFQTERGQ